MLKFRLCQYGTPVGSRFSGPETTASYREYNQTSFLWAIPGNTVAFGAGQDLDTVCTVIYQNVETHLHTQSTYGEHGY